MELCASCVYQPVCDNCEMSLNKRKKRDTMLQKKLYERHMKTVKKQAQRYDDFLAAERIKRATLWTDSGKLIDENAPLRLNHRKHQYKQQMNRTLFIFIYN